MRLPPRDAGDLTKHPRSQRWLVMALSVGLVLSAALAAGVSTRRPAPPTRPGYGPKKLAVSSPQSEFSREGDPRPVDVGRVTYAADVAQILQRRCQTCHRPHQVAPFSLLTYDQAQRWAGPIREAVEDRRMPPWHAHPDFGQFRNDRRLAPYERAVLLAWVDQGTPLGDPKQMPRPRKFPQGWSIGTPDLVLSMPKPYAVVAEGILGYQRFRVDTGFTQDRWISAAEARPGNRSVVHHICVFLADDRPKGDRMSDERRELVCYAPGDLPSVFPRGTAKLIPAGASIIIEVHYTPLGTVQSDQSSVGFIFAKDPVSRRAITKSISQKELSIPPGEPNYATASSFTFPNNARLLSLSPHMHLRGKDFRYTAKYPDGRTEVLLWVPAYDFSWQSVYRLDAPKPMPKGTRIDCLAHFDNSADNPANPDPTRAVGWGEQTFDEMMIGFIDYDEDISVAPAPMAESAHPRLVR